MYWWRTSHGEEVDFILEDQGKIIPIEVKLTAKAHQGLVKNLDSFCDLFHAEVKKGFLVNLSNKRLSMRNNIDILPLKELLQIIQGRH